MRSGALLCAAQFTECINVRPTWMQQWQQTFCSFASSPITHTHTHPARAKASGHRPESYCHSSLFGPGVNLLTSHSLIRLTFVFQSSFVVLSLYSKNTCFVFNVFKRHVSLCDVMEGTHGCSQGFLLPSENTLLPDGGRCKKQAEHQS